MTLVEFSTEVRKHHRLILWGGLVVVLYLVFLSGSSTIAHVYELRASVDQSKVLADAKAEKAATDQQKKDLVDYNIWKAASDAQIASLQNQLSNIQNSLRAKQAQDRVLASPELADRLNVLVGVPGGYKPNLDGLTASLQAGQSTVVLLDEVQADRDTIKAKDSLISQKDTDLTKRQGLLNDSNDNLAKCQTSLTDEKKFHSDDVNKLKAESRRGKLKWFGLGYVAGLLTRALI